jgi:hypothetical protein
MHRLEKIVFEEEAEETDPSFDSYAVGGRVVEVLKDQGRFKIPMWMADGFTPEMRDAVIRQMQPRDSRAFPRTGRAQVVDSQGGTMGLHRPGFRVFSPSGGTPGDKWLAEGLRDQALLERERYLDEIGNAWRGRDSKHRDDDDDDEVEARAAALRTALIKRGHPAADIGDYLDELDDDVLDGSIGDHVRTFEGRQRPAATDAARRLELERLYQQRDAELREAWRGRK